MFTLVKLGRHLLYSRTMSQDRIIELEARLLELKRSHIGLGPEPLMLTVEIYHVTRMLEAECLAFKSKLIRQNSNLKLACEIARSEEHPNSQ